MPRRLRFIPPEGAVVEVTTRTVQSRLLLKPSRYLNSIILGVLGRAQRRYDVRIHDFFFMSNHYHLLISVDSALQLARFMGYFNGNLAKEVARLTGWRDKVWSRRYQAILVSSEEKAQLARLRYIASHGLKENLIARANDWPGVSSIKARLAGQDTLEGRWYDRTREFNAGRKGLSATRDGLAEVETVRLTPLPCLARLSDEETTQTVREIVREIEESAATRRREAGIGTLGLREVLRQDPEARPMNSKRSSAPYSHCESKSERRRLWEAYCWFLSAYLEARERLRAGQHGVFPEGSFPAPAPFVDLAPAPG